ncbi:MAG: ATP-binding cassette domain-containing protein [Oscillospiraceae bacterium]|jgi:cell division transport system ATP-binding protein|nr:ATP-binding cassette domain-containing protein [Oscillospiraceae bacterium]
MIHIDNVSKTFVDGERMVHAIQGLTLHIKRGEFIFVVGRNTSGKSTLFNLITREIQPTEGAIVVDGIALGQIREKDLPYYRRRIGVVFQDFRLLPNMDVFDNVAYAMRVLHNHGDKEIRKRVAHVLNLVGLAQEKSRASIHQLSGGERQRVAIARAMVNNPKVMLADEPTGNIDPEMKVEIFRLMRGISAQQGTTVLMVTHDHDLVKQFTGRVVTLDSGKLAGDKVYRVPLARMPSAVFPAAASPLLPSDAQPQNARMPAPSEAPQSSGELGRLDSLLSLLNNRYGASA